MKVIDAMKDLHARLGRYLDDALGVATAFTPWEDGGRVPLFLRDRYRFSKVHLAGLPCLLMADKSEREESPATIRKHIDQVRGKWDGPVIYVRERITAYNRKRLIGHKVAFIAPGNQMYLPMLGIDLREHFRKLRQERSGLAPATQAVLIHALSKSADDLGPTILSKKLGYSVMAMSRALDELEAAGLGDSTASGRERRFDFGKPKREAWEKALLLLQSPVTKRHAIRAAPNRALPGPRSGLGALAHYSNLAEPEGAAIALGREGWKSLRKKGAAEAMADEPDAITVEVWSYAPALFSSGGWVDRLSLYLSLRDTQDERVQAALEQVIKEFSW